MKTIDNAGLADHLDQEVTGLVTCWIIEREDGTIFRFTDATEDLTVDTFVYASVGAYKRTAIETTSTLSVDNLDIIGVAGDLSLPEQDLRNGLFDNARISVFMTSWSGVVPGKIKLRRGFFGEVQALPNGTFQVELRGLMQRLAYNYLDMFSVSCLYDLGEPACGIVIRPDQVKRSTAYAVGDVVLAAQSSSVNLGKRYDFDIEDAGFESIGSTGISNSLDWYDSGANPMQVTGALVYSGTAALRGPGSGAGELSQTIELESATDMNMSIVEASNASIELNGYYYTNGNTVQVVLDFLDKDHAVISGYDSGAQSPGTTWTRFSSGSLAVPAATKMIRISLAASGAEAYFDAISAKLYDNTVQDDTFLPTDLNNVYWECTVAGTTAGTYPGTFSGGPSSTAVDGTVTWTARDGWLRGGRVVDADDRRTFTATITEPRAVDAWFNAGAVTFVTGLNAGVTTEVKGWIQSTGEVELFLSVPAEINADDEFLIYPGCDKTRISCAAIFQNTANFFGFPDVPGQDEYLRYPDAKS